MNQLAKLIGDIATGQVEDNVVETDPKARKRCEARAAKLTPEQRSEIARRAAQARWNKSE
jgi:hypothetical protein